MARAGVCDDEHHDARRSRDRVCAYRVSSSRLLYVRSKKSWLYSCNSYASVLHKSLTYVFEELFCVIAYTQLVAWKETCVKQRVRRQRHKKLPGRRERAVVMTTIVVTALELLHEESWVVFLTNQLSLLLSSVWQRSACKIAGGVILSHENGTKQTFITITIVVSRTKNKSASCAQATHERDVCIPPIIFMWTCKNVWRRA